MIYIFSLTIIITLIKQRDKLLKKKRNLVIYLLLSVIGISLGIIYSLNPYLPSLSAYLEMYLREVST